MSQAARMARRRRASVCALLRERERSLSRRHEPLEEPRDGVRAHVNARDRGRLKRRDAPEARGGGGERCRLGRGAAVFNRLRG